MSKFRFRLDGLTLALNDRAVTVAPAGLNGDHLEAYWGPNGPYWTPHITRPHCPPRERKIWLAKKLPYEKFLGFLKQLSHALGQRWLACARRVELSELAAEEWLAVLPSSEAREAFAREHLEIRPGVYRSVSEVMDPAWDFFVESLSEIEKVEELPEGGRFAQIVRVVEDRLESRWLAWLPFDPHDATLGAGWFWLPFDWMTPRDLAGLIAPLVGPGFFNALRTIAQVLDLVDLERVAEVEELWRRTSASMA